MHDALLMRVVYRPGHRFQQFGGDARRLWFAAGEVGQRLALDQLERDIGMPVLLTDVEDLHDVGMRQPGHDLGLRRNARDDSPRRGRRPGSSSSATNRLSRRSRAL